MHKEPWQPNWTGLQDHVGDHPVIMVSWEDAQDFCRWAKLYLPTEAEWEKAARGTSARKWPWGDAWDPGPRCNFADEKCPLDVVSIGGEDKVGAQLMKEKGWYWDREHSDGYPFTSPVGSFPRGASPYGALDMAGNVWQWCEDWYDPNAYERYARGDESPPRSGSERVARGGSWNTDARCSRTTARGKNLPDTRQDSMGFRVVLR
jgi:formylglycine-generating enzyme required for sulfatase activity